MNADREVKWRINPIILCCVYKHAEQAQLIWILVPDGNKKGWIDNEDVWIQWNTLHNLNPIQWPMIGFWINV